MSPPFSLLLFSSPSPFTHTPPPSSPFYSCATGRRPDRTQAVSFVDHFREVGKEWATLPQHFRESGWQTYGAGKLFHPGLPPSFDARKSWDEFVWSQGDGTCTTAPSRFPRLRGRRGS